MSKILVLPSEFTKLAKTFKKEPVNEFAKTVLRDASSPLKSAKKITEINVDPNALKTFEPSPAYPFAKVSKEYADAIQAYNKPNIIYKD